MNNYIKKEEDNTKYSVKNDYFTYIVASSFQKMI